MLRSLFFYVYFILYVLFTFINNIKYQYYKKFKGKDISEKYLKKVVYDWGRNSISKTGSKVKVIGMENLPEGNCLFVGNHQSLFDIPLMVSAIDKSMGFIAKDNLIKVPIISAWMRRMHCIFINRSNVREAIKSINEGIENLRNGYSMVIFPEGTRSKDGSIGEFKKGSLKLGTKIDIPIVPITINGTFNIFEAQGKIKPAKITLIISKPIYAKNYTKAEQGELSEFIKEIINSNLKEI
ncbi:MAG TPA: lysophospholipid acyltransferase family protein [Clostridiaceae bacterium]